MPHMAFHRVNAPLTPRTRELIHMNDFRKYLQKWRKVFVPRSVCVSSAVNLAWTWINRDHQAQEQLGSPLCSQVVKDQVPCGYQTLFWPLLHTEYIYILLGQHLYDLFHQADLPRICSLFLNPLNFHGKQGASSLWNRTTGINSSSTSRQVSSISWLSWEADL